MNRLRIKDIYKRVEALSPVKMVMIPHYENGIYKPIKMEFSEALKLVREQIDANK